MVYHFTFHLSDDDGSPLEGQSPTVVLFRKADGSSATPVPTVVDKGNGFYDLGVDVELHGAVGFAIDCGVNSSVKYLTGSVGQLVVFPLYDAEGELDTTGVPTFLSYTDGTTDLPAPVLVDMTGGLWSFWPEVTPGTLVHYTVGDAGNKYSGTLGATGLLNPVPAADTEVQDTQVLTFDVLDSETYLGRVLVGIYYEEWDATELVWDGQAICGPFQVTVTQLDSGLRYSILRRGGWPSSPTVRVFLTNQAGREI